MLLDTSVLVSLFRDNTGTVAPKLERLLDGQDYYLNRFTQIELLQGARDEAEWLKLSDYLGCQDYLEMHDDMWSDAARTYFTLRRLGLSVRSVIDCCVAETAISHDVTLLHSDPDFLTISKVRPLKNLFIQEAAFTGFHEDAQPAIL